MPGGIELCASADGVVHTTSRGCYRAVAAAAASVAASQGRSARRGARVELVVTDGRSEARFGPTGKEKVTATSTLPPGFVGLQA
ncbi:MAG: hypothetical protein AB7I19_18175 [Planctomycetota bacterium]